MVVVWVVLIGYLGLLLGTSFYAKKFIHNTTDFLLAGRKLGLVLVTATLAATHFGGGFILGEASWGAKYGLGGIWYGLACGVGLILLGVTLAKPMRAMLVFTVPEILELRFHSQTLKLLSAFLSLAAMIGIIGAQVWACSAVFEALGMSGTWGAIIATSLFVAYTAFSGMWAVALTDFIQVIVGAVGVIVATVLAYIKIGGITGLRTALQNIDGLPQSPESYFHFSSPGIPLIGLTLAATTMYTLIGQDFYQRLFSAKSAAIARSGAILSGFFLILISFVPAIAGMLSLALTDDPQALLANPKNAIPELLFMILGNGLGALFMAAILAAVMSTADSLLSAATSHVVKDFYQGVINPNVSDQILLRLSRFTTIGIGFLALITALKVKSIVGLLIYSYDIYTAGIFVPLILGLYWKRATKEGALAGLAGGLVVVLLAIAKIVEFNQQEYVYLSGALVSFVLMVGVSLFTKPIAYNEKLEQAFHPNIEK